MRTSVLTAIIVAMSLKCVAQANTWTQKANFPGTPRYFPVGFSIGNNGYLTTGSGANGLFNDLWQWNQDSDAWTQEASLPGDARVGAVGFAIGAKGYIGTGYNGTAGSLADFWEWDQATNTWAQKANFPGGATWDGVGFSIGTKGYIGTGVANGQGFWEWSQASNTWEQKASLPGSGYRLGCVGFSIGAKGYIGMGTNNPNGGFGPGYYTDFYEWDSTTNTWAQKANFPGGARSYCSGFSIGTFGYAGTGMDASGNFTMDFWGWDQTSNQWTQKADFGGGARAFVSPGRFVIGTKGYFAPALSGSLSAATIGVDFWEYQADTAATSGINAYVQGKQQVNVFPNPFQSTSVISFPDGFWGKEMNVVTIDVFDVLGKKVKSYTVESQQKQIEINASDLGVAGTYFYHILCNNQTISYGKLAIL